MKFLNLYQVEQLLNFWMMKPLQRCAAYWQLIKAVAHDDDDVAHNDVAHNDDVARNATLDAVAKTKNAHEGIN